MKKSPLPVLFAAVLVDMMGFGIVLPLLPFYAESMGATPLQVTILVASFSAMQLAAAPLWGRVSDKVGRRPLLIASLFASSFSYLLFGLADNYWWLLLSRMAAGAAGGTITIAQAYVADTTAHEHRARGMGHLGAASGLGVMLGPAVGAFVSDWWGLGAPGFVAAGFCALNGTAAIFLVPESHTEDRRVLDEGQARTVRAWFKTMTAYPLSVLLTVYFLTISSFAALTSILALYLERSFGVDEKDMGMLFTLSGATTVVVRGLLLGLLVKRIGESFTVRVGIFSLLAAVIIVPLIPSAPWALAVAALYAFGAGTLFPALASLVSRATDRASQGSIMGGSQVVGGFGRVVGPLWAGFFFQQVGIATPFNVGAVMVLLAMMFALRIPARGVQPAPSPAPVAAD